MTETNVFQSRFEKLNFGTVVSSTNHETVEVEIDPNEIMKDYGEAVVHDLERRNPLKFQSTVKQFQNSGLFKIDGEAEDAFIDYFNQYMTDLVRIRIQSINRNCKIWRIAKTLAVPPYVQWAISQIGETYDMIHGRKFIPVFSNNELALSVDQLLKITEYLKSFELDGVVMIYNGFKSDPAGDSETMAYAIIDGYIKSPDHYSNPAKSYIAAFLGMKLRQESTFRALYSVSYDSVDLIKYQLIRALLD